jgi:hypothetical protein
MSTAEKIPPRAEIPAVLRELRSRIRRYVVLEGSARVLAIFGAAVWFSLAVDYWLEPSVGVRRAVILLALAGIAAAAVWYLVLRLARDFRSRALALVLERRFPELNDRLITAVEIAESGQRHSGLTASMLERTADEAAELTRGLSLGEVFNRRPLLRAISLAVCLVVSLAGFALAADEVFSTWFRRSVLLADEYYRRDTDLRVYVVAEPGERVVEFKEGVYRHPRGGDLTFLAEVPEGRRVPERVQFTYRNVAARGGSSDFMTKIGARKFRQKLVGLHNSIDLWLRGGDYSTRSPLRIEIVEPPQLERLSLEALYPDYTGLNVVGDRDEPSAPRAVRQTVPVLGAQVSLPAGTDFLLTARSNKPLRRVRFQTDGFEFTCDRGAAQGTLTVRSAPGDVVPSVSAPIKGLVLAADGRTLAVPFVLAVVAAPEVVSPAGQVHLPLPLVPDPVLRITLHDDDDVVSSEPVRLAVNSIADAPPQVETRLKGIGNSVTRQATIPVVGEARDPQDASKVYGVTDDYGIAEARFEYKVDAAKPEAKQSTYQAAPFAHAPEGARQFPVDEKFRVLPLDLVIGQRFALKVVAVDGDTLTGPHVASGTPYNFQVVSDDELLALVAVKELNIRRRFEQILEEVKNTRKDLLLHRARLDEARAAGAPGGSAPREADVRDPPNAVDVAVATSVERSLSGIRKNANETQSIELEFGDIRDELENNAVPDVKPMLERIDLGIIKPLHTVNTLDYNNVDDSLVLLRKMLEEKADPFARFDESVDQLNLTVEHLEAVLAQMLKLETVNEALQMLRDIIKAQEELQDKTRQERKKKLIEGLQ